MAMGTRKRRGRQQQLWVASSDIVRTPANAFYDRLNEILNRRDFDRRVEHLCRRYYNGPQYHARCVLPLVVDRLL
jgi:hypothetical protein